MIYLRTSYPTYVIHGKDAYDFLVYKFLAVLNILHVKDTISCKYSPRYRNSITQ